MLRSMQSANKFLRSKLPVSAKILLEPSETWAFATGNPELWRLSYGDEAESGITGWYSRPVQIDYWRNDGDLWTAATTCDTALAAIGFAQNPYAIVPVGRYSYSSTPALFRSWMQMTLTLGQSWKTYPLIEPDTKILRYSLSLTLVYSKA